MVPGTGPGIGTARAGERAGRLAGSRDRCLAVAVISVAAVVKSDWPAIVAKAKSTQEGGAARGGDYALVALTDRDDAMLMDEGGSI